MVGGSVKTGADAVGVGAVGAAQGFVGYVVEFAGDGGERAGGEVEFYRGVGGEVDGVAEGKPSLDLAVIGGGDAEDALSGDDGAADPFGGVADEGGAVAGRGDLETGELGFKEVHFEAFFFDGAAGSAEGAAGTGVEEGLLAELALFGLGGAQTLGGDLEFAGEHDVVVGEEQLARLHGVVGADEDVFDDTFERSANGDGVGGDEFAGDEDGEPDREKERAENEDGPEKRFAGEGAGGAAEKFGEAGEEVGAVERAVGGEPGFHPLDEEAQFDVAPREVAGEEEAAAGFGGRFGTKRNPERMGGEPAGPVAGEVGREIGGGEQAGFAAVEVAAHAGEPLGVGRVGLDLGEPGKRLDLTVQPEGGLVVGREEMRVVDRDETKGGDRFGRAGTPNEREEDFEGIRCGGGPGLRGRDFGHGLS